jgi:hypothetical protein
MDALFQGSEITDFSDLAPGFSPVAQHQNAVREARVFGAAEVWADFREGALRPHYMMAAMSTNFQEDSGAFEYLCRRYPKVFRETMTTSDFSALTVDVLDRQLLADYREVPVPVMPLVKSATLADFRNKKTFIFDGMETPFKSVAELEDLPLRDLTPRTPILYAPLKYEAGGKVSWEAVINDDLGVFNDMSQRLARGARRTKWKFITNLYSSATGPNSNLYTSGFANQIIPANGSSTTNPPLSVAALNDAMTVLLNQRDAGGDPIQIPGRLFLVVGPSLMVTANNIMHQLSVDVNVMGGTVQGAGVTPTNTVYNAQRVKVDNWIVQNMTVIVDPYLPIVTTSAGVKLTQWYIFADPAEQGRYAIEIGDLRGYADPQLYQKVPNTMRVGGGVEPLLGDFRSMSTEFKALLAFGGTVMDGRSTVASTGQNA